MSGILAITQQRIVRLTPSRIKGVKAGTVYPPPSAERFTWICYANHPCSGVPPFMTEDQIGKGPIWPTATWPDHPEDHPGAGDPPADPPPPDPWRNWMIEFNKAMWGTTKAPADGGNPDGWAPGWDWLDSTERYLVRTWTMRVQGMIVGAPLYGTAAIMKRVTKYHKNTNAIWWDDYQYSMDDGGTWSGLYHWEIANSGTVTESGSLAAYPTSGSYDNWLGVPFWAIDWFQDVTGILVDAGLGLVEGTGPWNMVSSIGPTSASITENVMYFDPAISPIVAPNRNFLVTSTYEMSNDSAWSVALARAQCDILSGSVHFEHGNREYPAGSGDSMNPAEDIIESITAEYLAPVPAAGGSPALPLRIGYTFDYPSSTGVSVAGVGPWFDGSAPFPAVEGDISPVCANLLDTSFSGVPGYVRQMKTMFGLIPVCQRKSIPEVVSVPGDNGIPSPLPTDITTYDGEMQVKGTAEFIASAGGVHQYFTVPSPWQGVEIIWPAP